MENNKPSLLDTIKEWSSVILSGLGIVFLITMMRKGGSDNTQLQSDIKDIEDNIKDIEESDPNIDEIVARWNNRK